ncbi:hypothetical protein [Sulfurimonas sp.]|uniref:hypothetical protein n=1 Tax=Sulfurimonas sp. TaxID=2022749 RepID=UPI002AB0960C|nr:hypothetical protein [Sulfurimonas sp.]
MQHLENVKNQEARLQEVIDIIARSEYDDIHKEVIEYEKQVRMKDHDVIQLNEKLNGLTEQKILVTQDYQNKLLEELTQKRKEATLLKVEIDSIEFRKAKQRITSPVDGLFLNSWFILLVV